MPQAVYSCVKYDITEVEMSYSHWDLWTLRQLGWCSRQLRGECRLLSRKYEAIRSDLVGNIPSDQGLIMSYEEKDLILLLQKTKTTVQADDNLKEAQNHQINWETDIQAKIQITMAINISDGHCSPRYENQEVFTSNGKTLQSVNSDRIQNINK